MILQINDKNEIIGYSKIGSIEGGQEVDDQQKPIDFEDNFKPKFYLLQNNEIVVNPNYEEPTISVPETPEPSGPSPEMLAINALGIQLAKHLAGGD